MTHEALNRPETGSNMPADIDELCSTHEVGKPSPGDLDEMLVVAGFEVNLGQAHEMTIHERSQPEGRTDRRHGSRLAIRKQPRQLRLGREATASPRCS